MPRWSLRDVLILLACAGMLFIDAVHPWSRGVDPPTAEWREYWAVMIQGGLPACAASGNRHCLAVPHF